MSEDNVAATVDPITEWINQHQTELQQHRGQHVAIHPERGIVASGCDFSTVRNAVEAAALGDDVVFHIVPL